MSKQLFRFLWCCHYWKKVSTGRGNGTNVCSLSRCRGKLCLLLHRKHYKWRNHHTGLYLLEPLRYYGSYVLKNLPIVSGFPLLGILSDSSSFLYFFLDNFSSCSTPNLRSTSSKVPSLTFTGHAG